MSDILMIGIAGGTGSGKSTLTNRIKEIFGENVTVLMHDNYYKAHNDMTYEERTRLNYDHPNAFDTDLPPYERQRTAQEDVPRPHRRVLFPSSRGSALRWLHRFSAHNRSKETITIHPNKVMIIEGILIFECKELTDLMDIKIYVDTDADVRILRRILRDVEERGRSLTSVVNQYLETVKPMHEQFVEPSKKYADIIVPEGGKNQVALDMIMQRIKSHIGE